MEGAIIEAMNERNQGGRRKAWRAASAVFQLVKEGEAEQRWLQELEIVCSGLEAQTDLWGSRFHKDRCTQRAKRLLMQ